MSAMKNLFEKIQNNDTLTQQENNFMAAAIRKGNRNFLKTEIATNLMHNKNFEMAYEDEHKLILCKNGITVTIETKE